jgi:hypothetical protein
MSKRAAERRQNAPPSLDEQRIGRQDDERAEADELPAKIRSGENLPNRRDLRAERPRGRADQRGDENPAQDPQKCARFQVWTYSSRSFSSSS